MIEVASLIEVTQSYGPTVSSPVPLEKTFFVSVCVSGFCRLGSDAGMIPRYVGYHSQFRIVLGSKVTLMDFKARVGVSVF